MKEIITAWIAATAWRIEPPKAYGLFHITFFLLGGCLSFLLARRLRNLSDVGHRKLMLGIGSFLAICESYKQLLYCTIISPDSYSWGDFPFHLCSVPMYLCLILAFLKPGSSQKALSSFMMLYNLLGGGISFLEPSGLLHSYATLTAHSMIWHMLLVFIGLYLYFSGRGGLEIRDFKHATAIFVTLCAIAFCLNLALRKVSGGNLNAFFIGPSDSPLIVFHWISETFGWYISTPIYILALCLGAWIIRCIMHQCKK